LGSDTNFFIQGETALCRGRGERIEQLEQRHLKLLLILPPWSCSTPKVFSALKSDDWKSDARNHLAEACCRAYPEMQQLMKELSHHQVHAELSGSGSTLYVDQDSLGSLDQSYQTLLEHFEHCKVIKVESYHRCESE
jgi:4-diphosphocytidyl-2C-methyl-D-erythritol kinase